MLALQRQCHAACYELASSSTLDGISKAVHASNKGTGLRDDDDDVCVCVCVFVCD